MPDTDKPDMRPILASLLTLACLTAGVPASAQTLPDTYRDEGDVFYMQGDYYRAVTRYNLYLMHAPLSPFRDEVKLKMAWMYHQGDRHIAGASLLRDIILSRPTLDGLAMWSRLYYAQNAQEANQAELAQRAYERVLEDCQQSASGMNVDAPPQGRVFKVVSAEDCQQLSTYARIGLARHYIKLHDFKQATGQLKLVPSASAAYDDAQRIRLYVDQLELPTKSPVAAGVLSIVPGLGHFYIEEYSSGMVALLWNGAFIYALVDSIIDGRYGQAALIGLVESVWYTGTIFGAVAGAHRFNRDARRVVERGVGRDLDALDDTSSWPARWPVSDGSSRFRLNLSFQF